MSERQRKPTASAPVVEWQLVVGQSGDSPEARQRRAKADVLLIVLGTVFPLVVVLVEWSQRLCASAFFDPMPTTWHMALISAVPLTNLVGVLTLRARPDGVPVWLAPLLGAAVAVAGFYALLFLPLAPLAVLAIAFYGLGLLPFGPLMAFAVALRLSTRLARRTGSTWRARSVWLGALAGLALLIGLDVPQAMTRLGLKWASEAEDADQRERGLWVLRTLGSRDQLLRLAYDTGGTPSGPLSLLIGLGRQPFFGPDQLQQTASTDTVREVFYRVYGKPFSAFPPPETSRQWARFDEFEFDPDLGGGMVGGRVKGLDLVSSRLDASLNGSEAVGYLEWIFEFRNRATVDREARLTLALPPGGVVSRATLWVGGEEREAAYGARESVRKAYEQVAVRQRRDPLLVTTRGADRVLAQAFPVPAGGTLKFKIGITAPLDVVAAERAELTLPAILERNFGIGSEMRHALWLESRQTLGLKGVPVAMASRGTSEGHRLEGQISEAVLAQARPVVSVARPAQSGKAFARLVSGVTVVQSFKSATPSTDGDLRIVIDGSSQMAAHASDITAALQSLPPGRRVGLTIASEPMTIVPTAPFDAQQARRFSDALRANAFAGGQDNAPALAAVLKETTNAERDEVWWIHGPQPVRFAGTRSLLDQVSERVKAFPKLTLYAVETGPNEVLPDVPWAWRASLWPRHGDTRTDLTALASRRSARAGLEAVRETGQAPSASSEGSGHLARLWARDEVLRLVATGEEASRAAAVALATEQRIVTPVSGAVVLETAAQYAANNLSPAAKASVPTVPEPHEWALLILLALMMLFMLRRRAGPLSSGSLA